MEATKEFHGRKEQHEGLREMMKNKAAEKEAADVTPLGWGR